MCATCIILKEMKQNPPGTGLQERLSHALPGVTPGTEGSGRRAQGGELTH